MAGTTDEISLWEQLVARYREVAALGLNEGSSGNLSVRFGAGMLISPSGANAESLAAPTSSKPHGTVRTPAAACLPRSGGCTRRSTNATPIPPPWCTPTRTTAVAVASHGLALPGFHYLVGVFGGDDVPCVPYSTFGSQELADGAADALAERTACLLGNHGMIARGPSLARQLGEPGRLTDREWEDFRRQAGEMAYAGHG